MKKILSLLVVTTLFHTGFSQSWVGVEDILKHAGETVNFVGQVSSVAPVKNSEDYKIIVAPMGASLTQTITLLISAAALSRKYNETILCQYVHVKGLIGLTNGKPQMRIKSTKQISIVKEARESYNFEPL